MFCIHRRHAKSFSFFRRRVSVDIIVTPVSKIFCCCTFPLFTVLQNLLKKYNLFCLRGKIQKTAE